MSRFGKKIESTTYKSLCVIDYAITNELMLSMDYDGGWESLGIAAGYNFLQILRLKDLRTHGKSPTSTLLWELGCQGFKVKDLYEKLASKNRKREMGILEDYVRKHNEPPLSRMLEPIERQNEAEETKKETQKACDTKFGNEYDQTERDSFLRKIKIPGVENSDSDDEVEGAVGGIGGPADIKKIPEVQNQRKKAVLSDASNKNYGDKLIPGSEAEEVSTSQNKSGFSSVTGDSFQNQPCESVDPTQLTDSDNNSITSSIGPSASQVVVTVPEEHNFISAMGAREFKYRFLFQATSGFDKTLFLGEGAFGSVFKGYYNGYDIAVKCLKKSDSSQNFDFKSIMEEVSLFSGLRHKNIIALYGYALDGPNPCLVYQYLGNGSLEDRLSLKHCTQPLSWEQRLKIMVGACEGLQFLHTRDKPVIHGDIKSANILLDADLLAKLADLGQARYATGQSRDTTGYTHVSVVQTKTKMFGTKAYYPPEVLKSGQMSIKSDVYAMGIVFLEVCSGQQAYDPNRSMGRFLADLFEELEEDQWMSNFCDRHLRESDMVEESFRDVLSLAKTCINELKNKRPKTEKLLNQITKRYEHFLTVSREKKSQLPLNTHLPNLRRDMNGTSLGSVRPAISGEHHPSQTEFSIEAQFGDCEALKLQQAHDRCRAERERLRQEGVEDTSIVDEQLHQICEEIRQTSLGSITQHSIDKFQKQEKINPSESSSTSFDEDSEFPKSDPKKLEQLLNFDVNNFATLHDSNEKINTDVVYQCDPRKLAYLQEQGDSYLQSKEHPAANNNVCTVTPSASSIKPNEYMNQNIATQKEQDHHSGFTPQSWQKSDNPSETGANKILNAITPPLHTTGIDKSVQALSSVAPMMNETRNTSVYSTLSHDRHITNNSEEHHMVVAGQQGVNSCIPIQYNQLPHHAPQTQVVDNDCYVGHYRNETAKKKTKKSDLDDLMANFAGDFE